MRCFTSFGPQSGVLLYNAALGAIAVLDAPDGATPIGMALCVGVDTLSYALWELVVHDAIVPGRWVVVDREFVPAT